MTDIQEKLKDAYLQGTFLAVAYELSTSGKEIRLEIPNAFVTLNNSQDINIIGIYSTLKNSPDYPNFFMLRSLLDKALPELERPVIEVMRCVLHLTKEAGQDMTAGSLFSPYLEYCAQAVERSDEALGLILANIDELADMLSPSIVAGARHDIERFTNEAINLTNHADIEIQKRALFSLGKIQYSAARSLSTEAADTLKAAVANEKDDILLGTAVKATFDLYKQESRLEEDITKIIGQALDKGVENTLYAAAEIFGFNIDDTPPALLELIIRHLPEVKPEHKGTLDNIDYGLDKLLSKIDPEAGITLLGRLLSANDGATTMDAFDSTLAMLYRNENNILDRLATRWLFGGKPQLCRALRQIVSYGHKTEILLHSTEDELEKKDYIHIEFVTRKAIGYLFNHPVTAAEFILSLLPYAGDEHSRNAIADHLFDPLFLNYPGKIKAHLDSVLSNSPDASVDAACKGAINNYDLYIDNLKAADAITEHHPSLTNDESYRKYLSREMRISMKEAEKQSVFLSIIKKSVLLYGRKSISYVDHPGAPSNRMEMPLQSFTTAMEIPRLQNIDPVGINHLLRVFRYEEIRT